MCLQAFVLGRKEEERDLCRGRTALSGSGGSSLCRMMREGLYSSEAVATSLENPGPRLPGSSE